MRFKYRYWTSVALFFVLSGVITAFCVFSNSDKEYRVYRGLDLPFVYQINSHTDSTYFPGIKAGASTWNKVRAAYFNFEYGGLTSASEVGQDNINLVYFDDGEGGNFDVGTNVIAFSLTFTSNEGGFHATESDLIWNSREFPPGMHGESNRIDLQSVVTHELGHHMGIAHFTEFGGPPGCGVEYSTATMAGGVSVGDTTRRSLHEQDIAAAIELYPEWKLLVNVTDDSTGEAIQYAKIQIDSAKGLFTGDPEAIQGYQLDECPGYIIGDSILTNRLGERMIAVEDSVFSVRISAFGYNPDTVAVNFNPANAVFGTETIPLDISLEKQEWQRLAISLRDSTSGTQVHGNAEFYAVNDPAPEPTATVSLDSTYQETLLLPPGFYDVYVTGEYPYAATWFDSVQVQQSSLSFGFDLSPAQILVISGDRNSISSKTYLTMFDSLGYKYYNWDAGSMGDSLPPTDQFWRFKRPMKLFVISEFENGDYLNDVWHDYLLENIDRIGNVMLAGNKIVGSLFHTELLNDKLGMQYVGATNKIRLKSAADDALTDKWEWIVLADDATNQVVLDTIRGYPNTVSMDYEDNGGPGLVYYETDTLKVAVVPFSMYKMIQFSSIMLSKGQLMERINAWMDVSTPTAIEPEQNTPVPTAFTMQSNYPNPFNPSTTITWNMPKASNITIRIFNILGQNIFTKKLSGLQPGEHQWIWRGENDLNRQVASGIYWLRLSTPEVSRSQKMMLLR